MKISRYTPGKLEIFRSFITSAVQSSARAIKNAQQSPWRRVPPTIYLFDIGCADGADSTALLVHAAQEVVTQFPVGYHLFGFERNRRRATDAQARYANNPHVTIYQGNVQRKLASVLPHVPPTAYGLAVIDLWKIPPWTIQEQLSKQCHMVDHLALYCGGGFKRHAHRSVQWQQARMPRTNLQRVDKKFILIAEPWGPSQFVEMYFTNYAKLAAARNSLGMVPLQSPLGQARWNALHTVQQPGLRRWKREQRAKIRELQMDMFSNMNMEESTDQRKLPPGGR